MLKCLTLSRAGWCALSIAVPVYLPSARAATLYWDGTSTSADADGGSGIWTKGTDPPANWDTSATGGSDVPWTSSSEAVFGGAGAAVTISGTVAASVVRFTVPGYSLNEGTLVPTGAAVIDVAGNDVTIGSILAASASIRKTGAGMLTLAGANTFGGLFTIAEGIVKVGSSSAFGSNLSGTTVEPGATMDLNGQSIGLEALSISGSGVNGAGAIVNNGGGDHISTDSITLNGPTSVGGISRWGIGRAGASQSLLMLGHLLTKVGPNDFHLVNVRVSNPTNVDVKEGSFWVELQTALEGGIANVITIRDGAMLGLYNNYYYAPSWTIAFEGNSTWFTRNLMSRWNGPVTLAGATIFGTEDAGVQMSNTGIISGPGSITKTGPGTWILSASNTYSGGTTVNAGRLEVAQSLGSGPLTVAAGATLAGGASMTAPATIHGTIDPGLSSNASSFSTGPATITGNYVCQLGQDFSDRLTVTGDLTLDGATLTLNKTFTSSSLASYTIATYTGNLSGQFASLTGLPTGYVVKYDAAAKAILVTRTTFATWIAEFPLLGDPTPDGDPDGDGIPNLLEYVLEGDPALPDRTILPVQTLGDSLFYFRYKRSNRSLGSSTQVVQWSPDLTTWYNIPVMANSSTHVKITGNGSAPDDVFVTIPYVPGGAYARLKVTVP